VSVCKGTNFPYKFERHTTAFAVNLLLKMMLGYVLFSLRLAIQMVSSTGPFLGQTSRSTSTTGMTASRPESFNKSFMQLKEMNFSLLTLLNM
jgi:hypothetical protein